jgi:protein MpaA
MNDNHLVPRQKRASINHKVKIFGKSLLGMPLEVFLPQNEKTDYLVVAGQHGNEPETTVLLSSVLRSIPKGSLRCAVVLCLNPDGLARGTRCNAAGVDLNRNFPSSNWSSQKVYYSWNDENPRDTELSPGKGPASEPETKSIIRLIEDYHIKNLISIHSPLSCIDDPDKTDMAKSLSETMNLPLVSDIGYETPGSLGSWGKENGIAVVTIELPFDTLQDLRRKFSIPVEKLLTGKLW